MFDPSRDFVERFGIGEEFVLHRHNLGAEEPQELYLFFADVVADIEFGSVAARRGDSRKANTGVSARHINDEVPRLQLPGCFGRSDDRPGNAVFDAAGWIEILQLGNDRPGKLRFRA